MRINSIKPYHYNSPEKIAFGNKNYITVCDTEYALETLYKKGYKFPDNITKFKRLYSAAKKVFDTHKHKRRVTVVDTDFEHIKQEKFADIANEFFHGKDKIKDPELAVDRFLKSKNDKNVQKNGFK